MSRLASRGQLRASFIRWALLCIPAVVLLGLLSGAASGNGDGNPWFASLDKPALYPPPILFPIAWTVLYVLMGLALALVCNAWGARGRTAAIFAFVVQFALNLAWSPLFFAAHQITAALILIVAMGIAIVATMVLFWRVRRAAAVLLVPYLAWVCFASVLNYQILALNPQADGASSSGAAQRIAI
ncbi:tryptophan-rich sensory protein [Erythrobacter sp. 3-20A1M]|uniref:TspO/MBR family protein n=1 Tax=Erythrobacter sp. 3-20A1M TaxID=2653850 RepID=UPI001BFCD052|nr:TspO/MBR family protein [Erythrobacter sp. 3-20A1M]QWC55960.1 tryptophan-rich sensory protein [Erythrobacter sp. 3-20A1M]